MIPTTPRTAARTTAALAALILSASLAACGGAASTASSETTAAAPAETVTTVAVPTVVEPTTAASTTASVTVPDVVGMTGDKAQDALKAAGLTALPDWEDEAGAESVWNPANWTVTAQDPAAGSSATSEQDITLTVHHDTGSAATETTAATDGGTTSSSDGSTNSQGLMESTASYYCGQEWEDTLQKMYPSSDVKAHSILGVLNEELQSDDRFFIKLEISVDNADYDGECYVGGSNDSPVVELGSIY